MSRVLGTCVVESIYQGKTEKAIKVHIKNEGKFYWLPISQIEDVSSEDDSEELEIGDLTPGDDILVRIPLWLACKLTQCEGRQELENLELSYLTID